MPVNTTQPIANTFPRLQIGSTYLNYAKVEPTIEAAKLPYEGFESIGTDSKTYREHLYGKIGMQLTFSGAYAQDYTLTATGLYAGNFLTNAILYLNKNNINLNIQWTKLGIDRVRWTNDIDTDKPVQVSFDATVSGQVFVNL